MNPAPAPAPLLTRWGRWGYYALAAVTTFDLIVGGIDHDWRTVASNMIILLLVGVVLDLASRWDNRAADLRAQVALSTELLRLTRQMEALLADSGALFRLGLRWAKPAPDGLPDLTGNSLGYGPKS